VGNRTVPDIKVPKEPDSDAKKEEGLFEDGDLEQAKKQNAHKELGRADGLRQHIFCASIVAIWVLFAIIMAALVSIAWYYLGPQKWQWLTDNQVAFIKGGLLSGGGGALLSSLINHYLKK
jgi:hypothetical protein